MGSALTILLLLTFSVLVTRIAATALRLTGLPNNVARFQALSAFSGAGFTTTETEAVVNYPVRRRIITWLIIVGNLGLVAILSTVIVGFVNTGGAGQAARLVAWVLVAIAFVWVFLLNPVSDRVMCGLIDRILRATTELGTRRFHRLLQVGDGWSVCEHPVDGEARIAPERLAERSVTVLAVRRLDGTVDHCPAGMMTLAAGDRVIAHGPDDVHGRWETELLGPGEGT